MKDTYTKAVKKKLRALAGMAHQAELTAEISKLENDFARWRAGHLTLFELSDLIHTFHDGPARDLHKRYVLGDVDWAVADAIERGIVQEAEAGPEVILALTRKLNFLREQKG